MVSSLAYQFGKNKLVTGFGVRKSCRSSLTGRGVVSNASASIIRMVGNVLVNKLANAVQGQGGSFKVSGVGVKPRKHRVTTKAKTAKRKTKKPRSTLTYRKRC